MKMQSLSAAFRTAFAGLGYAIRTQRNIRIHLAAAGAVIIVGLIVGVNLLEWAILALTIGFVFVSEMFNTVVEATVDLVTTERHPLAKAAKDVAAGGVVTAALISVVVGLLILGPRLWTWLRLQ